MKLLVLILIATNFGSIIANMIAYKITLNIAHVVLAMFNVGALMLSIFVLNELRS